MFSGRRYVGIHMQLFDIPVEYFTAGIILWLFVGAFLVWRSEWIAVGILALFFFYQVIVFVVLGGAVVPFGQITLLFFGPLLLLSMVLRDKPPLMMRNVLPYFAMAAAMVLSLLWNGLNLWEFKSALNPILVGMLIYFAISTVREMRRFLVAFAVLLTINNVIAVLQYAGVESLYLPVHVDNMVTAAGLRRGIGIFGHFMETGLLSGAVIPLAVMGVAGTQAKRAKALWALLACVGVAGLGVSGLRAGLGGALIGIGVSVYLWRGVAAIPFLVRASVVAAVFIALTPNVEQALTGLVRHASEVDNSALQRPLLAMKGLKLWLTSPIFGAGTDGLSRMVTGRVGMGNAHNSYVSALSDYGLLGFAAFMSIIVMSLLRLRQAAHRFPEVRHVFHGITGALVCLYVAIFVHPIEDMPVFWVFPALALATARFLPRSLGDGVSRHGPTRWSPTARLPSQPSLPKRT